MVVKDWVTRGRRFEAAEKNEWTQHENNYGGDVSFEHTLPVEGGRRGRVDILVSVDNGSLTVIEAKASDWDSMPEHRVRPNLLRHIRQVKKYVFAILDQGIDVQPALVYPCAPRSVERRLLIESLLEEHCIQLVWHQERTR